MQCIKRTIFQLVTSFFLLAGLPAAGIARDPSPDTQDLFERYSDRVGKIEVVNIKSGAKSSIGSGFYVSAKGHIITNYHVISRLIYYPDRYKAEFIDHGGTSRPVTLVAIDVLNDLALVWSDAAPAQYFRITPLRAAQGARLYSLGYPHDIGISIVEGTHNGYLKRSAYRRVHFTGSLNPGMSGGPAITSSGQVAGINVATAGNQVSFLIPVEAAADLIASASSREAGASVDFIESVRSQIMTHQESHVAEDLMRSGETVQLGNFTLPGKLTPSFNCWADSSTRKNAAYEVIIHECSSNDSIYVSHTHKPGIIKLRHRLLTTEDLNPSRFYKLYSDFFSQGYGEVSGSEEEVTRYRCRTDAVDHKGMTFKTVFCARSYRKLTGLYDVTFKAAALGSEDSGLETTLVLSGVTFEKAIRLTKDYLERISWSK